MQRLTFWEIAQFKKLNPWAAMKSDKFIERLITEAKTNEENTMSNYHTTNDEKRMLRLMLTAQVMTLQAELNAMIGNGFDNSPMSRTTFAKKVAVQELQGKITNLTSYLEDRENGVADEPPKGPVFIPNVVTVVNNVLYHWYVMPGDTPAGQYRLEGKDHGYCYSEETAWHEANQRASTLNG